MRYEKYYVTFKLLTCPGGHKLVWLDECFMVSESFVFIVLADAVQQVTLVFFFSNYKVRLVLHCFFRKKCLKNYLNKIWINFFQNEKL